MRNFSTIPSSNYVGQPFAFAVQLSAGLRSIVVPLTINWLIYGAATAAPNQVVSADLSNVAGKTGTIQSVYIDNTGSNVSVYVRCLDTNYTVVAQPNSEGWYPIFTNLMEFQIIGMGFTDGSIPTTAVLFSNLRIIPAIATELPTALNMGLASSSITRGTGIQNQNYGINALGDQTINFSDFFAGGFTGVLHSGIWNSPQPSGFIYLTHIAVSAIAAGVGAVTWVIESTGAAGNLYTFIVAAVAGQFSVCNLSGMNVKLDATQTWRIRVSANASGGTTLLNHTFVWTQNPQ